jgi:16S rRNA (cytidine1402-2'-O)-methyltransferase
LPGLLYLVSTPIGNLEDITLRAIRILRDEASLIACEDTRQTQKLLDHFEIRTPLVSYHEHNEKARSPELLERLAAGENVALVSDAGTPLVSDPGYRIVASAIEQGIVIVPVPGVCAAIAALSASGLPTDEFRFCGFLPPKSGARRRFLDRLQAERATLVVYESPHRIVESLDDIAAVLGNRRIVLARELTKIHEEFLRGTVIEVLEQLRARPAVKGEMTVLIARTDDVITEGDPAVEVARLQASGISRMDAIKTVAKQFGLGKRDLYRQLEGQSKPK